MKFIQRCIGVLVLFASILPSLTAQSLVVDAGLRGGVFASAPPLEAFSNHYFPPQYTTDRTLFSVGPDVSAMLYNHVDLRFEAVRSNFTFHGRSIAGPSSSITTTRGSLWQFPLIATYLFGSNQTRSFAGGGMSLTSQVRGKTTGTSTLQFPGQLPQTSNIDSSYRPFSRATAYYISGGLEARLSKVTIRPEFRYARWASITDQENQTLNSRNQFEVVIGFAFHAFTSEH
jgi:hypothetical protein